MAGLILLLFDITRETVEGDTPARFATSFIVIMCFPPKLCGHLCAAFHHGSEFGFESKVEGRFKKSKDVGLLEQCSNMAAVNTYEVNTIENNIE